MNKADRTRLPRMARLPPAGVSANALDGANPLAFMAALGLLRTLTRAWPNRDARLGWARHGGSSQPTLVCSPGAIQDEVVAVAHDQLAQMVGHVAFTFSDDLKILPGCFRKFAEVAASSAKVDCAADYAAAFGTDSLINEDGTIQDTAFRTMSGAGHQHFLAFMNELARITTAEHLRGALFSPWHYDEEKLSLRWDPADDRRYALRWSDPSGDVIRTVRGANRLAIEALPLFPVMPVGGQLKTTGFSSPYDRGTYWTWPIWEAPVSLDVCRSLVALAELQRPQPNRPLLLAQGVAEVFRCQRITIGKYRNFTPAQTV